MVNKQMQKSQPKQENLPQAPINIPTDLLTKMQETLDACLPATSKAVQTLNDSIVIANGLNELREFFKNDEVKRLVETMQDTTLGFLTDRSPDKLKQYNAKKPPEWQKHAYTYDEIVEALIPPMMEGYRFTGNEINIINGKGMPVKNGKHRRINDLVTGFIHSVGSPVKDKATGVAKMRCQAKWMKDGHEQSIGYGDEQCIIPVEYDQYAGLDKLIGLAESKLFSRVLTRISGKLVVEGDIPTEDLKDVTPVKEKTKPKTGSSVNIMEGKKQTETNITFVEKLSTIVDDSEYSTVIKSLMDEGKIQSAEELRTKDEQKAKEIFIIMEQYKGFEEAEKNLEE